MIKYVSYDLIVLDIFIWFLAMGIFICTLTWYTLKYIKLFWLKWNIKYITEIHIK